MRIQGAEDHVRATQAEECDGDGSGGAQREKVLLRVGKLPSQPREGPPRGVATKEGRLDGSERLRQLVGDAVGCAMFKADPEISHAGGPHVED